MAAAAARSALRAAPSSLRSAAARIASESGASRSPLLRLPRRSSVASRFFRRPAEMSFCVESLMPMHSATAAALLTSMLSVSLRGYGWLSEGATHIIIVKLAILRCSVPPVLIFGVYTTGASKPTPSNGDAQKMQKYLFMDGRDKY